MMTKLFTMFFLTIFMCQEASTHRATKPSPIIAHLKSSSAEQSSAIYTFQAPDLSASSSLVLNIIDRNGLNTIKFPVALDSKGFVVDKQENAISIECGNYGYGESLRVYLKEYEKDSALVADDLFEAIPLTVADKNGHSMSIVTTDAAGQNFQITLAGFKPHEIVQLDSRSCHETSRIPIPMENDGSRVFGYSPAVIGKKEGPFALSVSNADTEFSLQHYWGQIAFTLPKDYPKLKEKFPDFFAK